jgi:hypothetical protein
LLFPSQYPYNDVVLKLLRELSRNEEIATAIAKTPFALSRLVTILETSGTMTTLKYTCAVLLNIISVSGSVNEENEEFYTKAVRIVSHIPFTKSMTLDFLIARLLETFCAAASLNSSGFGLKQLREELATPIVLERLVSTINRRDAFTQMAGVNCLKAISETHPEAIRRTRWATESCVLLLWRRPARCYEDLVLTLNNLASKQPSDSCDCAGCRGSGCVDSWGQSGCTSAESSSKSLSSLPPAQQSQSVDDLTVDSALGLTLSLDFDFGAVLKPEAEAEGSEGDQATLTQSRSCLSSTKSLSSTKDAEIEFSTNSGKQTPPGWEAMLALRSAKSQERAKDAVARLPTVSSVPDGELEFL